MICQTNNSVISNSLSLKYQRFTPSGCKDIGVRKYKFVAKTQFFAKHPVLLNVLDIWAIGHVVPQSKLSSSIESEGSDGNIFAVG